MRVREMKQCASQADVVTTYRNFTDDMTNLSVVAGNRQHVSQHCCLYPIT